VSTEHNVWSSHAWPTRLANASTLPLDDVRLAVSQEVRSSMWKPWQAKTRVLLQGVPVAALRRRRQEREESRSELRIAPDDVVVTVVANLRANKDYPTLFRAAEAALRQAPSLRFMSIGQGPLEESLRSDLRSRDLGDRFVMLGYHSDPARVLAASDIFTLSSRFEGLPIAMLEAMAQGLPVVATAVGGVAEVVREGCEGLLVPAGDHDALAAAYTRLALRPDLRRELGERAAQRAGDFDISVAARQLEVIYRELAQRRRRR
jgi:glycosyltransferase involved in cell wall biosynthesis